MKLRLSLVILIAIFISFTSCNKDKITRQTGYLNNLTSHNIVILFYKNGIVEPNDTLKIAPYETVIIGKGSTYGNNQSPGFPSEYGSSGLDPYVVIFDQQYSVVHYNEITDSTVKHYPYESNRNFRNINNYKFHREEDRKDAFNNVHNYYFTEADYNYAKE